MLDKSPELKAERGYVEPDSFVRLDGSEVLKGDDWDDRKQELFRRANGRCERFSILQRGHHVGCHGWGDEPHHIIHRWPKRDDRLENLAYLSHACHSAEDKRKIGGRK